MQRQYVRRTCDFCNNSTDFDVQDLTPAQEQEMGNWFTLAREYVINGQPTPLVKHACRQSCASNLISTGALSIPEAKDQNHG